MSSTKTRRNTIFLAVVAVLLAGAGTALSVMFAGCRTPDESGYAELQAGKEDFRAKNYDSAVAHFRSAAEQGNATAQLLLGVCCREGNGVEQNDAEAAKWFRAAAEQGSTDAMVLYSGNCLWKGKGVEKDEKTAMEWMKKAADAGNTTAQALYGSALMSRDRETEGLEYMKRSADSGDVLGLFFLGGVYLEMTKEEAPLGFDCMKKAANMPLTEKKSMIDCIDSLSVAFGGDLDLDEKYNNNTNRIIVRAQYIVGSLYRSGELPGGRNMDESLKWMNKAKENGSAEAATYLKTIEMMQRDQGH